MAASLAALIRPCSGLDSKKSWQADDNDEEHAMSHRLGFDNCALRRSEDFCNAFPFKADIRAEHSGKTF
jgi:hypothetical protein